MSRKRLLLLFLIVYFVAVFIPFMVYTYVKNPTNFLSAAKDVVAKLPVVSKLVTPKSNVATKESTETNSVFGNLANENTNTGKAKEFLNAMSSGTFNGLVGDTVSIGDSAISSGKFTQDSILFCIKSKTITASGTEIDNSKVFMDASSTGDVDFNNLINKYKSIPYEKRLSVLSSYTKGSPIQFSVSNDSLNWVRIYKDSCAEFK